MSQYTDLLTISQTDAQAFGPSNSDSQEQLSCSPFVRPTWPPAWREFFTNLDDPLTAYRLYRILTQKKPSQFEGYFKARLVMWLDGKRSRPFPLSNAELKSISQDDDLERMGQAYNRAA